MTSIATIRVRSSRATYRDRLAQYRVLLDDEIFGSVKNGKSVDLIVAPGPYRLRLKVWDGKSSPEVYSFNGVHHLEVGIV